MNSKVGIKNLIIYTLVISVILLSLVACGKEEQPDTKEKVKISFSWYGSGSKNAAINKAIDVWNSINPSMQVESLGQSEAGYHKMLRDGLANGDAPDIFQISLNNYENEAKKGHLLEINNFAKRDLKDIDQTMWKRLSYDGDVYALPMSVTSQVLLYNIDVLDKYAVQWPMEHETWDSLYEKCVDLKEKSNDDDVWGLTNPLIADAATYTEYLESYGINVWNSDYTRADFANPETILLFKEQFERFSNDGLTIPNGYQGEKGKTYIVAGHCAFSLKDADQLLKIKDLDDNIKVTMGVDGAEYGGAVSLKPVTAIAINANIGDEKKEVAFKFLQWLLTSEEAGNVKLLNAGIPSSSTQRETVLEQVSYYQSRIVDTVQKTYTLKNECDHNFPSSMKKFEETFAKYRKKYINGKITIDEFLTEVSKRSENIMTSKNK